MNIVEADTFFNIMAKTCRHCKEKKDSNRDEKKVTYSLVDACHSICIDRKDIILAELLEACERLLKYTSDEIDRSTIKVETGELRTTLKAKGLISQVS